MDQKSQDEELSYLKKIISIMPANIYWKNREGVYLGCNDNILKLLKIEKSKDFIGKTAYDLIDKDLADYITKIDEGVMATNQSYELEEEAFDPEGNPATYFTRKVPIHDSTGEVSGLVGISIDITARKKIETELIEAKKLAVAASIAKSEFLGSVSHELRIPLTGIIGMAQLLSVDYLMPGQKEQVEDILKASEHLLSLVNDLLDLTKLEAGKMELRTAPVNLKALVEEVVNMMSFQVGAKGLELIVNYEPSVPSLVVGDARALRQVLLNLLGNSLKFTSKGYILVKIENLSNSNTFAKLQISIQDTGVGIPKEKQKIIFDRFGQADSSYSRRYGGTGLGLTLTKHIVELMGGEISFESEENKGTTFQCTIPFLLQEKTEADSPWEIYRTKVKVLIVDDTLKGNILNKHIACTNSTVVPGKEAMQTLLTAERQSEPYDIVLIDQQISTANSLELAEKINKQLTRRKPMLILLAQPLSFLEREAIKKRGFYDSFTKPLQPSELLISLTVVWEKWFEKRILDRTRTSTHRKSSPKVLLVEDDVIVQKVHRMMLERTGCKVEVANDGKQTLELFPRGYDIIFMDIGLPEGSGLDITMKLRELEPKDKHTPIIAMTAYVHEEDKKNCIKAGMDEVITKPIHLLDLEHILERWVPITDSKENN